MVVIFGWYCMGYFVKVVVEGFFMDVFMVVIRGFYVIVGNVVIEGCYIVVGIGLI